MKPSFSPPWLLETSLQNMNRVSIGPGGHFRRLQLLGRSLVVPTFAVIAVAFGFPSGCKKDDESGIQLSRKGDKPPVETIEGSAQFDLGSAKELEPNNSASSATVLKMPVVASGVISGPADVDVFSFVAPKSGHVRVVVGGVEGIDLIVEVSEAGAKPRIGDRGAKGASEGVANIAVKKGVSYSVTVREFVKKNSKKPPREGDSPRYQLEVSPLAVGGMDEVEPNDDPANAKKLLVGDRPTGFIGWAHDIDYWKLSLDGFREVDLIDISIDGVDGVSLILEVVGPDGSEVLTRKGEKSGSVYVRGLLPGGNEYLIAKVTAKRSHESERYRFHFATRRAIDGEEVEPNDKASQATSLGEPSDKDGEASGEIAVGDTDFFVLPPAPVRRSFDVTVTASSSVVLEAVASGEVLATAKGTTRSLSVIVEPKTRARLRVKTSSRGEPEEYSLAWKTGDAPLEDFETDQDDPGSELE